MKIVLIGAGSMAEALIAGWTSKQVIHPSCIYVKNRSNQARLQFLKNSYAIEIVEQDNQLSNADLIILAMKPKDTKQALQAITPFLGEHTKILSVCAGIPIEKIEKIVGSRAIARAMPNTSATIGLSATGIYFNSYCSDSFKQLLRTLLEAVGIVVEVEEDQLHAVTALSGSGPAYIYYLMEIFENVAYKYGLDAEHTRALMVQTLAGSAAMLSQRPEQPSILRKNVTSPGGTTEAGIQALDEHQFQLAIESCIESAEKRSRQLADSL